MTTWQAGLSLALAFAAAGGPARAEQPAAGGYVHGLSGSTTLQARDAAPRPLKVGDLVQSGDIVSAADDGSATVKLADGQLMLLGTASSFRVTEYRYDRTSAETSRAVFGLLKGTLRVVGGMLGATRADVVKIAAGSATVGIGGTDATLIYDPLVQTLTVVANSGVAQLSTLGGARTIEAGAYSVASRNAIPALPLGLRAAPVRVQLAASTMLSAQNIPPNTPVSVEASARAVAAQARADELQAQAAANPQNGALKEQATQAQQQATQAADAAAAAAQRDPLHSGAVQPAPAASPQAPKVP